MVFRDRIDAGEQLARALSEYKGRDAAVLALPRGGVPVAAEIAKVLSAPLDLILVRKIGAPFQPELAIGAVVDGASPTIVRNEDLIRESGVSEKEFAGICAREQQEIERRRREYLAGRAPLDPKGKVAIVVDDGLATGATMRAALRATRARGPSELVMAVPVAPRDALEGFAKEADRIVCLDTPEPFGAVGYFYRNFDPVGDEEVMALLRQYAPKPAGTTEVRH